MLENFFKRFRQDNGIAAEVENSPYVNVEGLEGKIFVPEATREDRKWSRRLRNATSEEVTAALDTAIAEQQNWRVWFLLNRPLKEEREVMFLHFAEKGFNAETALSRALSQAAQHDNVTAAYLLLKYAEKNAPEDTVKEAMAARALLALQDAAEKPGAEVFALFARSFATLDKEDHQVLMKETALRAAAAGHTSHLTALLDNRLLTPPQFVEAYMASFFIEKTLGGDPEKAPQGRKQMLDWMLQKGIVDPVFADEAAMVETRMMDAENFRKAAAALGWKQSTRDLPLSDGSVAKADHSQVEITLEGAMTYVFNFAANRAHRIKGQVVQELPPAQVDEKLAEQGKQFLDSVMIAAPQLEWKKGEPFRLRFKVPQN